MDIQTINITPYLFYGGITLAGTAIGISTFKFFKERSEKMLDFYVDNIKGNSEYERLQQYKEAEDEGLIGDVPTPREMVRLEKRLEKRLERRISKNLNNLVGLATK